jgi:MFS family permease
MGSSLLARLPLGMTSLAVVILISRRDSYTRAGLAVALYVAGAGVAGPVMGRLVDRVGRRLVMIPSALVQAGLLCVLAAEGYRSTTGLVITSVGAGLSTPPVTAAARSIWPSLLHEDDVASVYALEATLQELVFIVGPSTVSLIISFASPSVAVYVSAAALVAGVVTFCAHPAVAAAPSHHPEVTRQADDSVTTGARRRALPLAAANVAVMVVGSFNFVELATVAFARSHHQQTATGVVLACWSAGSMLGGLVLGNRLNRADDLRRRLAGMLVVLALMTLLPALAGSVWVLAGLLFVNGTAIAPSLAVLYRLVAMEAPPGRQTETFGWLGSAFQIGTSGGALAAGAIIQSSGPRPGYLAAAGVVVLAVPPLLHRARAAGTSATSEQPETVRLAPGQGPD